MFPKDHHSREGQPVTNPLPFGKAAVSIPLCEQRRDGCEISKIAETVNVSAHPKSRKKVQIKR